MARIEISLEEYNELKNTIKRLENENGEQLKNIQHLNDLLNVYREELDEIINSSAFFDRVFKWGEVTKNAKKILH